MNKFSDRIKIDDENETIEIFGVRYSSEIFDWLSKPTPEGQWMRVTGVDHGVCTVETVENKSIPDDASNAIKWFVALLETIPTISRH